MLKKKSFIILGLAGLWTNVNAGCLAYTYINGYFICSAYSTGSTEYEVSVNHASPNKTKVIAVSVAPVPPPAGEPMGIELCENNGGGQPSGVQSFEVPYSPYFDTYTNSTLLTAADQTGNANTYTGTGSASIFATDSWGNFLYPESVAYLNSNCNSSSNLLWQAVDYAACNANITSYYKENGQTQRTEKLFCHLDNCKADTPIDYDNLKYLPRSYSCELIPN